MPNTILTSQEIANEALAVLENNLVVAKNVNRQYEKEWSSGDKKKGDTINVKKPAQYKVRDGKNVDLQDHEEESVPLILDKQKGVDVAFDSKELRLDIDSFSDQILKPQMAALSNQIDRDVLLMFKGVANAVGNPGTTAEDFETFLMAGVLLDNNAAPVDEQRGLVVNPLTQMKAVNANKSIFNNSPELKSQYEKGKMGTAAGFDWAMSQNIPTHTVGAYAGTPLVDGVVADGASSVETDGWDPNIVGALNVGDIFVFTGVQSVNPQSKDSTGMFKQFVVTQIVSSDGAGKATIHFDPPLHLDGAKQNVTALPANNAAIAIFGDAGTITPVNLAYHKDAITLATVDLPLPKGMDMAARASSKKVGLSVRFLRGYDISTDRFVSRLDVLYGIALLRPEHVCRIHS